MSEAAHGRPEETGEEVRGEKVPLQVELNSPLSLPVGHFPSCLQ